MVRVRVRVRVGLRLGLGLGLTLVAIEPFRAKRDHVYRCKVFRRRQNALRLGTFFTEQASPVIMVPLERYCFILQCCRVSL